MRDLQIYNTLSRKKEHFQPIKPNHIGLYVCGVTVYDYCHIGHARVYVVFDAIAKFLRHLGWDVTYVRNITDIDDKILNRAAEQNIDYRALTDQFIKEMHSDFAALGIAPVDLEPRATASIDDIIALIQSLVDKGFAYRASNGDVYYRVAKFEGYGKLSGKKPDELLSGARVGVEHEKEDPRDFALWKSAGEDEVNWPSPWGTGRPGWHIECSAMSKACLGASFDIHGGGPDLPFPHHENEIAQSEAANGCCYANTWMHVGAVRVGAEKMSKSLGNFFTIREVIEKYHPEVVRFLLLSSHYRSYISYTEDNLLEAKNGLDRFYYSLRDCNLGSDTHVSDEVFNASSHYQSFVDAMSDDFNTREAFSVMYELAAQINQQLKQGEVTEATQNAAILKRLGALLGVLQSEPNTYLQSGGADGLSEVEIEALIAERTQAKLDKDYQRADDIRTQLTEAGIQLDDSREGTRWRRL